MLAKQAGYDIVASPLYKLRSRSKLAKLLRISNGDLRRLCHGDALYREFDLPKKSGGMRHVENPARPLKLAQAHLARLLSRIAPPDYLYCPVRGRCYVSNALQHAGHRVVRSLDIKKFFPSTTSSRVFWFFHKILRCERDVAGVLARLSTYKSHLPTGSPLSPILAFFAHIDMWEAIADICRSRGFTLTVYVDDCTVSGQHVTKRDMWLIKQEIHRTGLRYHKEKAYFDGFAEVTGVILRDRTVVAPNRQLLKLRQADVALPLADEAQRRNLENKIAGLRGQLRQISLANLE